MVCFSAVTFSSHVSAVLLVMAYALCWITCSSTAFSLEEEFLQLKENYFQMVEAIKIMESRIQQQDSLLSVLLLQENKQRSADTSQLSSVSSINRMPSSCSDLKIIGHIWSGFYSVMGPTTMESVYCDFTKLPSDADFQKWIGYDVVKSAPTYFYVSRNQNNFNTIGIPITFQISYLNIGNAMNLTSGIFTAPRTGTYFFSFKATAGFLTARVSTFEVSLCMKKTDDPYADFIGSALVQEATTNSVHYSTLSLQSTLNLKSGDQVWLEVNWVNSEAFLFDTGGHHTHFTGFLLEEDIFGSL